MKKISFVFIIVFLYILLCLGVDYYKDYVIMHASGRDFSIEHRFLYDTFIFYDEHSKVDYSDSIANIDRIYIMCLAVGVFGKHLASLKK